MTRERIYLFDTTLRDGQQTPGLDFSVADKIDIGASRRSGLVLVTVDDNGPGVPEENREDVFKPFYRADNARGTGGAGLGLTIARDVIRGHGGDIMLGDSPLGGLRVVIRLPV